MNRLDLLDLLRNGESSGVEFKLDAIGHRDLAKELVAFANLDGGMVLLGVADDGLPVGTERANLEEWVMPVPRS